jgi:Flp pilus assembly protein TadD
LLFQRGQRSEAIEHYRAALRLVPNNMEVINNLGCALIDENQSREGLELLHRVVAANPTDPVLTINMGRALAKTAQYPEAIACYQYALKLQPDSAKARVLLSKALVEVREAVRLNPNQVELLNCLAWLLATSANPEWRNGAEAVQLAERAAQLTQYLNSPVLDTLGAAYAEAGRWQEAIATAQKAIALAESAGNKKLARQIRGHLEAYQAGRPVSE